MNSTTARISAAQLAVLLVLSRLFILLIFVPDTAQAPSGTTALLGIVLGYLLTILLLLPLWKLMQQHPGSFPPWQAAFFVCRNRCAGQQT